MNYILSDIVKKEFKTGTAAYRLKTKIAYVITPWIAWKEARKPKHEHKQFAA